MSEHGEVNVRITEASEQVDEELNARKEQALASVRAVQRLYRTLSVCTEERQRCETGLLQAKTAEDKATLRLSEAVARLLQI